MKLFRNAIKATAALLVFFTVSCNDEEREVTVGGEVLPGSSVRFETDMLQNAISLTSLKTNKIRTNNLPYYRLGNFDGFKYELALKPIRANKDDIRGTDNEETTFVKFKEASLVLAYRYENLLDDKNDATTNVNTLTIREGNLGTNTPLKVKADFIEQKILIGEPESAVLGVAGYFSDGSTTVGTASNTIKKNPNSVAPEFSINIPKEAVAVEVSRNEEIRNGNLRRSNNIEDAGGAVVIPLPKEKFENYFKTTDDSAVLSRKILIDKSTSTNFENTFKAIYVEVAENQESLIQLLSSNRFVISRMKVIFDIVDASGNPKTITENNTEGNSVTINSFEVPFDFVSDNNESQIINIINDLRPAKKTTNTIDLENGVNGTVATLKLLQNNLDNEFQKEQVISQAIMRFFAKTDDENFENLPNRLALNFSESANSIIDFNNNANNQNDALFKNHLLKKQKTAAGQVFYDLIVTEHIQQILNQATFREAEKGNMNLILSIYNDNETPAFIAAKATLGESGTDGFFINRGILYSNDKVSIYTENAADENVRPKLITKFTTIN